MRIRRPALIFIGISLVMHGQNDTASLTGKVQDLTGAGMPNASAQLRSEKHGTAFTAHTDDSGTFRVSGLPGDEYTLRIERPGFRSVTVRSIHISDGEQKSIPLLELTVGGCPDGDRLPEYLRFLPTKHAGTFEQLSGSIRDQWWARVRRSPSRT
jgi:hypothetical protein